MSTYKGFTTVQLHKPKRSKFDLSHEKRISTRMGRLTPVFISETLPNDTFKVNTEVMLRLAPLIAPIMHRVNVFVHFFFVPNRLLWKDWEAFITGGRLGTEAAPVPPNANFNSVATAAEELFNLGSLWDYFGSWPMPDTQCVALADRRFDLLPFAAHYKIWYDYYRDRNYVDDNDILPLPSGDLSAALYIDDLIRVRTRDWQKDYFTSALPWTQRGDEVLMPLEGTGVVTYLATSKIVGPTGGLQDLNVQTGTPAHVTTEGASTTGDARIENIDEVNVDTSDVSINDLRTALRLQEWLERNALAGSRYNESIMAHFARKTSDSRLQRAEYLGGGKVTVKISEVVTTAFSTDADTNLIPPANMAGHGLSFGNTNRFTYNCEEHGFVIGIMSVMPNSAYMQGIPRMFLGRNTFLDYPWPSFAHLGEQPVYKYELYGDGTNITADRSLQPIFGYQSRYSDWKYIPSSSHGDFRETLDFWHLTRKFGSSPILGTTFCTFEDGLQDRVFTVNGGDNLWCYIYNNCSVVRSLPYYGTPQL